MVGLRISDALTVSKARIMGNRFALKTVKNGTKLTVILPHQVVTALMPFQRHRPLTRDTSCGRESLRSNRSPASGRESWAGLTNNYPCWTTRADRFNSIVTSSGIHLPWNIYSRDLDAGFIADAVQQVSSSDRKVLCALGA